ncbi:hypothetical protein M569_16773 [Genlisea aurea]|uniref:Uncharacterized protein n=1 Tax=Genlisea aurea TaxID=192259 RepID=S8C0S3_9LAMI|nr:hypothetical protein M569_16773 [Genlisea aurea]
MTRNRKKNKKEMKCFYLLSLILVAFLVADVAGAGLCDGSCRSRCSRAGVVDRCLKYCGICCAKCNCVPSGTFGNKHQCPCYRDLRNSKGKPKCP